MLLGHEIRHRAYMVLVSVSDYQPSHLIRIFRDIAEVGYNLIYAGSVRLFHTGDYKIDYTPIDNQVMDLTRIAEIGDAGVTLMLGESTNVEKRGTTISERKVVETIERIFSLPGMGCDDITTMSPGPTCNLSSPDAIRVSALIGSP